MGHMERGEHSGGTYWMKEHEDVTGKGHKRTQV